MREPQLPRIDFGLDHVIVLLRAEGEPRTQINEHTQLNRVVTPTDATPTTIDLVILICWRPRLDLVRFAH